MTTFAQHDTVVELVDILDHAGTRPSAWLAQFGPARAAEAVLAEVAGRAGLFPGPARPTVVRIDLVAGERSLQYRLVTGPDGIEVSPGPAPDAPVAVRQDLAELLCAVFGPPGRFDATREIRTEEPTGPPSADPDDPAGVRQALGVAAAYQVTSALDRYRLDLTDLAVRFGSDKWGSHWYTPHYDRYFDRMRDRPVRLLEIGIGGYWDPAAGGASLRMWKHYFRRGIVHGLDVYDKHGIDEPRLVTHKGDQGDPGYLDGLAAEIGPLDIVIDDGSHINEHVITSFNALFPHVRPGGLYVIEDVQTAYWPGWGGRDGAPRNGAMTSIDLVNGLIDGLHHQERRGAPPSGTDLTVTGVHVHHNLAVIEKGTNAEQGAPAWVPRDEDPRIWLVPK